MGEYMTVENARRKRNERERKKSERNYKPTAVLPPIRQVSMHDWPFWLSGRFSNEIKDRFMSANCLNRQGRYEEEENIAAFWVKEMAAITLPPDSPNVQVSGNSREHWVRAGRGVTNSVLFAHECI